MKRKIIRKTSPFIWMILVILVALPAIYIPLKIHMRSSGPTGPPADGTAFKIYITDELKCYREPCG